MKSLRQLTNELLGIRMDAANVAVWNVVDEVNEYARLAINDAIATFPALIGMTYTSGVAHYGIVCLPQRAAVVTWVATRGSTTTPRRKIPQWQVEVTPATVFLHLPGNIEGDLDVSYIYRQPLFPADTTVQQLVADELSTSCSRALIDIYPSPPAFLELTGKEWDNNTDDLWAREVIMYSKVGDKSFSQLTRTIEGEEREWWVKTPISLCSIVPEEDLRPVMLMAQAVLYEFFLRHQVLYEQYTSMASTQALRLKDLQLLIRDLEARARLDYEARLQRHPPFPTRRQ